MGFFILGRIPNAKWSNSQFGVLERGLSLKYLYPTYTHHSFLLFPCRCLHTQETWRPNRSVGLKILHSKKSKSRVAPGKGDLSLHFALLDLFLSGLYPQAWGKMGVDAGTKTLHNYIQERRKEKLVRSKKILLAPIPLLTLQWLEPNGHVSLGKSTTSGEMKSPMLAQGGKSRRPLEELGVGPETLRFSSSLVRYLGMETC